MMQKRVVVSFRGGNTNDDDESVMACGGVMFRFNNARRPIGIGTGAVEGHATSGRSSEKHAVFKKEGRKDGVARRAFSTLGTRVRSV